MAYLPELHYCHICGDCGAIMLLNENYAICPECGNVEMDEEETGGDLSIDQADGILKGLKARESTIAAIKYETFTPPIEHDLADAGDIIRRLRAKLLHARAYLEYVDTYTDIRKMSAEQRQLYDVAWDALRWREEQ